MLATKPDSDDYLIYTANIDFVTGVHKDKEHVSRLLDTFKDSKGAILFQEGKNLRGDKSLAKILPESHEPRKIRAFHNEESEAKAGTGIITVGLPLFNTKLFFGGDTPDTLPRYNAKGVVRIGKDEKSPLTLISSHVPPMRSGRPAQLAFLQNLAQVTRTLTRRGEDWLVGGDFNMPIADAARVIGGKAYGEGIIGIITPLKVKDHGLNRYGLKNDLTDHYAAWVKI